MSRPSIKFTASPKRRMGFATKPVMLKEETFLDMLTMTKESLSVAQENYTASKPPLRNIDVTSEILKLMKNTAQKQSIQNDIAMMLSTDEPLPSQSKTAKKIVFADLRR